MDSSYYRGNEEEKLRLTFPFFSSLFSCIRENEGRRIVFVSRKEGGGKKEGKENQSQSISSCTFFGGKERGGGKG